MARLKSFETWAYGLLSGFIGGAATAGCSWLGLVTAKGLGVDVPSLNWKAGGIIMLVSGLSCALAFLKQSPLPPVDETK